MKNEVSRAILPGVALGAILVVGLFVVFLLTGEITPRLLLSILFVLVPYLMLSGSVIYRAMARKEQLPQNQMLATFSGIYLVVAFVATLVFNLLMLPMKLFVALELIVMVLGVVGMCYAIAAKRHIDQNEE